MKSKLLLATALLALPFAAVAGTTNTNMVTKDYSDAVATADDAMSMFANPEAQTVGDITYITGGIGAKEATYLKTVRKDYKLRAVSSGQKGAYLGKGNVVIKNSKGEELLNTDAGPLFYANLPKGSYTLEMTFDGKTQKKPVKFTGKAQELKFTFK